MVNTSVTLGHNFFLYARTRTVFKTGIIPYTDGPYFSLYFTSQTLHFLQTKVCGNPALSKSTGTIFCNSTFSLFVSLSHLGNSWDISSFSIKYNKYMSQWSVVSDLQCYYCHSFGAPQTVSYNNELNCWESRVSWQSRAYPDSPLTCRSRISLPLLRPPHSLRSNEIEIRPINNLLWLLSL